MHQNDYITFCVYNDVMYNYRATMIRSMLSSLESSILSSSSSSNSSHHHHPPVAAAGVCRQMASIMQSDHKLGQKSYKPLLKRPTSSRFTYYNILKFGSRAKECVIKLRHRVKLSELILIFVVYCRHI